jgi:hypothetical protein
VAKLEEGVEGVKTWNFGFTNDSGTRQIEFPRLANIYIVEIEIKNHVSYDERLLLLRIDLEDLSQIMIFRAPIF